MKKLLSLLKKDAILVSRNKTWTTFEVLIPVALLLIPMFFIREELLLSYKNEQLMNKVKRSFSGSSINMTLEDDLSDFEINVAGCRKVSEITIGKYNKSASARMIPQKFETRVNRSVKVCKPVAGLFTKTNQVVLIAPATLEQIELLEEDMNSPPGKYPASLYSQYLPLYYEAMTKNFKELAYFQRNRPLGKDRDVLHQLYIYEEEKGFSFFATISILIGICMMLPIISVVRTVVIEKESIQPYLNSIGLSRSLFYAEHFLFATIKGSILIFLTIILYCVVYQRFNAFWLLTGVFVYITTSVSFALLVSAFFSKPRRAIEAVLLLWVASLFLVAYVYEPSKWNTIPASIDFNQAFRSYFLAMEPHFVKDGGMSFMDGFSSGRDDQLCCLVYLLIMIFDAAVMGFGSVIVSRIVDKITSRIVNAFWATWKHEEISQVSTSDSGSENVLLGEEEADGRKEAVSDIHLENLVKIYPNGETAVNGLSLRAIRGQVSVLLGHNGCGKSTTFGMITGIYQPTAGSISIEGVDAVENRKEARRSIGYCPQYNPLYAKLTVKEHLRLVNSLKGGDSAAFEEDAELLLHQIELGDQRDVKAKDLSGGMQRKLCVCMALIGGSRVVLLDEPTAGMDPGARLDVQKMLDKVKTERTILLTTHYMDEAEKLGDWVFVMSHGKMAASGSLPYLKKKFGDGYLLTLVLGSHQKAEEAQSLVEKICTTYVENSALKDQRGQMIEVSLPESNKHQFLNLFEALETISERNFDSERLDQLSDETRDRVKSLDIVAMGMSVSSLEQVFIKIEKECDRVVYGIDEEEKRVRTEENFAALIKAKEEPPHSGFRLHVQQYCAFLHKRLIHFYRNPDQIISQFLVPLFLILVAASVLGEEKKIKMVNKSFTLADFPSSKVILQFEGKPDLRIKDYLTQFPQLQVMTKSIEKNVSSLVRDLKVGDKKIGLVIQVFKNRTELYYHETKRETLPIAANLLVNLKYLRINNTHPVGTYGLFIRFVPVESGLSSSVFSLMHIVFVYILIAALYFVIIPAVLFLIEERVSKFQHQQLLSGVDRRVFWSASVLWDFLLFAFVLVCTVVMLRIRGAYLEYYYLLIPSMILFFFASIFFVYLVSTFIKTPTAGLTILYSHRIAAFLVFFVLLVVIAMKYHANQNGTLMRSFYLLGIFDGGYIETYALSKLLMSQTKNLRKFESTRRFLFEYNSIFEFRAIWIDLIYLPALAVFFFLLFVSFRSKIFKKLIYGRRAIPRPRKREIYTSETSVSKTNGETSTMVKSSEAVTGETIVVVDKLVKDFRKLRAVNGVSLRVKQRECFGLLGQNGAGKTTTFDMLTGMTVPSGGRATVSGQSVTGRIQVGYCPQFDAMMSQFSGRQCLRIMARLQGYENCDDIVEMVLICVGMTEHANKRIQHCSGGQKRKLSVGIALISRAQCVMLDEPTAGIDPRARREIWDILHNIREKANTSILLTSHSMEECEALCTRIGVMREGELVAMGTSQELKSKYGCFYLMTLVLDKLERVEEVKAAVLEKWSDAILKTEPSRASLNMVYQLPKQPNDRWSATFQQVQQLARQLEVEDFMLTQATLEDAFLRLNAN